MAARLPLPKHDSLPVTILFHRDHPRDPVIVLQVPNADRTDSETYILRTDRADDMDWLDKLPGASSLRDQLTVEQHLAYDVKSGYTKALADLDAPTEMAQLVKNARDQAKNGSFVSRLHAVANHTRNPAMAALRRALCGRGGQR